MRDIKRFPTLRMSERTPRPLFLHTSRRSGGCSGSIRLNQVFVSVIVLLVTTSYVCSEETDDKWYSGMTFSYVNDLAKEKIFEQYVAHISKNGVPRPAAFIVRSVDADSPASKVGFVGVRVGGETAQAIKNATIFTLVDGKAFRKHEDLIPQESSLLTRICG